MREEELEIKTEMQVSEAKVKVIEALEKSMREDQELEESLIKDEIVTKPKGLHVKYKLNPDVPEWVPKERKLDTTVKQKVLFGTDTNNNIETSKVNVHSYEQKSDINQLNTISIARELNKPKADITKFDSSPMEYKSFLRQFDARVVANTDSYDERHNSLLQFTIGEPHRIVSGFSHLDAKKGYETALEEFNDRYGYPDIIAHAYVKRALDWSVIKPDNAKALDDFSIFLRECLYAVENVEAARILEDSENLKHLVKKLPYYLHEKWRNIVYDTKGRKETVKFAQLDNFVKKEAKKAIDPIYGKEVLSGTILSGKKADSSPKASGKTFVPRHLNTEVTSRWLDR
ncbi:uncharacterized protein [Mytilus edulis]|uniref:uncharacterized protein n=1 Tax=Mytilus edulis TaxID=6550 RepID=UPI0039EDFDD3